MEKIKMVNDYVMIQDLKLEDEVLDSGIIIPKAKYQRLAKVVVVGAESKFKEGDVIIKPIGRSTPISIDGEYYECIKEGLIFAVL